MLVNVYCTPITPIMISSILQIISQTVHSIVSCISTFTFDIAHHDPVLHVYNTVFFITFLEIRTINWRFNDELDNEFWLGFHIGSSVF